MTATLTKSIQQIGRQTAAGDHERIAELRHDQEALVEEIGEGVKMVARAVIGLAQGWARDRTMDSGSGESFERRPDAADVMLTVAECAERARVTPPTVREWIQCGQLLAVQTRPGGPYRVSAHAFTTMMSGLVVKAGSAPTPDEIAERVFKKRSSR